MFILQLCLIAVELYYHYRIVGIFLIGMILWRVVKIKYSKYVTDYKYCLLLYVIVLPLIAV